MDKKGSLTISTEELIRGMIGLGYRKKAKEMGKEYLNPQELKEMLSTLDKEDNLPKDLGQVMKYIANTKQKIICRMSEKKLIFYSYENGKLLVELFDNNKHTFSIHTFNDNLSELLVEFYDIDIDIERDNLDKPHSIKFDYDFFDLIHTVAEEELEQFIEEKVDNLIKDKNAKPTKEFLRDFKVNKQEVNQIIFMNDNRINFTEVFVQGKDCIWFVANEDIRKQELTISSIEIKTYLQKIEKLIKDFFTEFLKSKENRMRNKLFVLRRGLPFFVKSNTLLILCLGLLFINKSSWGYNGNTSFIVLIIQSEILFLFLSFIACFRREKSKLNIVNR